MTVYETTLDPMPAPKTLRQSWLRLHDRCPHSALLYLKHDGGAKSHPMMRGIAFHETVERLTRTCLEHGEVKVDHHHAKAVLQEVLMDHPEYVVPVSDMDALRIMLFHWAEHFECPVGALVEQRFHLETAGRIVSGTVDLAWVDGDTLHIRDYKAGFNLYSQDDVSGKDPETGQPKGAKALQMIVYALLAADGKPLDSDWQLPAGVNYFDCRFVFPYFANDDGVLERGLVLERHELIEHRDWLKVLLNRVEAGFLTGQWPAIPGSHCGTCPAPLECPIPVIQRKMKRVSPYERDPAELAEELMFLQADVKDLQKSLKQYAEQYGPIPVGSDQELSHKKIESSRLSKKAKDAIAAGGVASADDYQTSVSTRFDFRPKGTGF